jgi:uncharacterized protein YndB with AHSA1/START domain
MQGPEGEQHWGRTDYLKIVVHEQIDADDAFCDEEGHVNKELPGTNWHVTFTRTASGTKVGTTTSFESVEAMKRLIEMGVKEGTKMAHDNLEALLKKLAG